MSGASVCLILMTASHGLLPINKPFPDRDACEIGGLSMTDGRIVKGYVCVPPAIYDCSNPRPPIPKHQERME